MLGALAASLLLPAVSDAGPIPVEGIEPPPGVVSAQADLNEAYGTVERCGETTARLGFGAALAAATRRYFAALRRAQGIWGNAISRG
ncbi:MAG TPA: hypothetical protein VFS49_02045, partial [Croceibacterium sp.]|nr:hypothetical protein [Croceibacterium sp.]